MEAIIKMVAEKIGVSEEQAAIAVTTVLGFLKDKLPAGIGEHLDSFVNNDGTSGGGLGDLAGKLGEMFKK